MNTYKFGIARAMLALVLVVGILAPVAATAETEFYSDYFDGGVYSDVFDPGTYSDSFDGGFYSDNYNGGFYSDTFDGGFYSDSFDGGYYSDTFDGGLYSDTFDGGYYSDTFTDPGYSDYFNPGYSDYFDPGYSDYFDAGYSDYYDDEVYFDDECDCYSYGSRGSSYGGSSYSGSSRGYSTGGGYSVKPMSFGSPSYPTRTTTGGSSSNSSVSNVSNTTITNVDNSINDSFNNYNSNNVSYVAQATPQYPVVYTQPVYSAAPYCQIYQAQASGSGVTAAYLSWTSQNASSAYLSNVGTVSTNGSRTVWPTYTMTYTLTVYGYNGQSSQCSTTVQAYSTYTTPYVSLTQIPYTGFDLGTFGNAMYWAALLAFALGAGYLAIYYIPSVAFAGSRAKQFAPVVPAKAPILVAKENAEAKVAPIVSSIRKAGTTDTMAIVASKDGSMPKIVIARD